MITDCIRAAGWTSASDAPHLPSSPLATEMVHIRESDRLGDGGALHFPQWVGRSPVVPPRAGDGAAGLLPCGLGPFHGIGLRWFAALSAAVRPSAFRASSCRRRIRGIASVLAQAFPGSRRRPRSPAFAVCTRRAGKRTLARSMCCAAHLGTTRARVAKRRSWRTAPTPWLLTWTAGLPSSMTPALERGVAACSSGRRRHSRCESAGPDQFASHARRCVQHLAHRTIQMASRSKSGLSRPNCAAAHRRQLSSSLIARHLRRLV